MKKVLIGAPQHSSKMYAFDEWKKNIDRFTYDSFSIFLADNSDDEKNAEYINSVGVNCKWVKPDKNETIFERIARSHNEVRDFFLKSDYDYLLHLETDIIPPIDVIERLLAHEKPVVSACYDIFQGSKRKPMVQLMDSHHKNIQTFRVPLYVEEDEVLFFDGTLKQVFQAGLGCVLIRRDVVNMFEFRALKKNDISADTYWYNDLWANNIPVYVDTNIYCKHNNISWNNHILNKQQND